MADQISKVKLIIDTEGANTSLKDMQKVATQLKNELLRIEDRNTPEYEEKKKQYHTITGLIITEKDEILNVRKALESKKSVLTQFKEDFTRAFSVVSVLDAGKALFGFGQEAVKMSAKMSDAFSDIQKATGMTTKEVEELNEAIKKIDTRTAQESLLNIAKVGGQIGIAKTEMLGFVESVDKAVVALGDEFTGGAEEVAQKMGTLKNLFKDTKDLEAGEAINKIGSAINELGAAGSATGPVVADFATRIGQLGDLSPQIHETLGLGAAFQELGLTAEISAGGLTNIMLGAAKATGLYANQLGMTEAKFKDLINKNPNEFFLKLAESMKGMSNTQIVKTLDDLGIKSQEATKVMSLLSSKTELVREKQELAGKAMKEGTSLTKEFALKNENAAATLAKSEKALDNFKTEIGAGLLPMVVKLAAGFIFFINIIRSVPEFIKENKEMFIALGVAILSFNGSLIAATATSLYYTAVERSRTIATQAAATAQVVMNAVLTSNPIGLLIAGIAILVGGLITWYNKSETVRASVAGMWAAIKTLGMTIAELWVAFQTLNFSKIADIFKNGAARIGDSFNQGYNDKLKEGHETDKKAHAKHIDDKTNDTKKGATDAANASAAAQSEGLNKEAKQAADHRKKEAEECKKDERAALTAVEELRIESIKNDLAREIEKLKFKTAKEIEHLAESKAAETTKAAWTLALNQRLATDIKKLEDTALAKKIEDEKKANEIIDSMFEKSAQNQYQIETAKLTKKYAENVATINKLQIDEAKKNDFISRLDAEYIKANEALTKTHQEKIAKDELAIQQSRIKSEYEANKAINDAEFLLAGNNIEKLRVAKLNALNIEYNNKIENLRREETAERLTAEATGLETATIDKKYNALKLAAHLEHEKSKAQIETEHLKERADKNKAFFDGISALMKDDLVAFGQGMATKLGLEKSNFTAKQQMQLKDAAQVMQLAGEAVDFLKKKDEEKLKNTLDTLNKEYKAKKKTSDDELKVILDNLKVEQEKELAKANLSAKDKAAINAKYTKLIETARTSHDKFIDGLDKDLAVKEKAARLKSFEQQKKLNIAAAVINGAQAVLMALATTPFPVNLGIGLIIAAKTIMDVNRIKNQPPPDFERGKSPNFINNAGVVDGPSHRDGGVSLVDNRTGEVKGVVEGFEPLAVFNKDLYKNNKRVINLLLDKSLRGDNSPIFEMGKKPGYMGPPEAEIQAELENQANNDNGGGDIGGSSSGAGEGISESEVQAMTQESQNLMQTIAKNTEPTAAIVERLDILIQKFDAFPRELHASVSFQQMQQSTQQGNEAQSSNVIGG
jgi:hypothetical protein